MRVVLCDDNAKEREYFSKLTKEIAGQNSIFIELDIFESAKNLLFELEDELDKIDIFLLDINMPKLSGMEFANLIRSRGFNGEIVFLTVSKEHMLNAFDVRAFNYIVKGETSLEKTKSILLDVLNLCQEKSEEYILFTGIGEYRNIAISSIKYFEIKGKVVTVYYGADKSFEFISTMAKLENLLYAKNFIRIHRSFLVSSPAIASHSFKEVVLMDGTTIPLGRKYYADLKKIVSVSALILLLMTSFLGIKTAYAKEDRYKISIEKRPGEYETGLRKYVNEDTGEIHYEIIEATGHTWSEWKIEKEATVEEEGLMYRVCTKYPDSPHYEYMKVPRLNPINAGNIPQTANLESDLQVEKNSEEKLQPAKVSAANIGQNVEREQEYEKNGIRIDSDSRAKEIGISGQDVKNVGKLYNTALVLVADLAILTFTFGFIFWIVVILVPMITALIWIGKKKKEAKDKKR